MIAPATLLAFALTCAVIEITPGPNMAWLAALLLSRGWRIGLAAVAGVALGLSVYGILAALGVAAIIENSSFLYETLRWGGVAYLLWLAWDAWSSADEIAPEESAGEDHERASAFRRGLITNLLNPKAAVFYVAMLPEFLNVGAGRIWTQTLTLSAILCDHRHRDPHGHRAVREPAAPSHQHAGAGAPHPAHTRAGPCRHRDLVCILDEALARHFCYCPLRNAR